MVSYSEQENEFRIPGGTNFLIRIQFHQNSTWQGTIQWLEENKTLPFRSVLEMLHLMEEAVGNHRVQDRQSHLRTWMIRKDEGVAIPGKVGNNSLQPMKRKR